MNPGLKVRVSVGGRMKSEVHAIFRGNVQGVGFRAAAKAIAVQLNLVGYVCNCSDGSVELCAQGERSTLEHYVNKLATGFGVESKVQFSVPNKAYADFSIQSYS